MAVVVEESEQKLAQGCGIQLTKTLILSYVLIERDIHTADNVRLHAGRLLQCWQDWRLASLQKVENQTYPRVRAESTAQSLLMLVT